MYRKFTFILLVFIFLNGSTCENAQNKFENLEVIPLKDVYKDSFLVGNIINPRYISSLDHLELIEKHFNTVTCENDMKPDHLAPHSKGGAYRWDTADHIVNSMLERGIKVHGHVLVWHSQTHAWMTEGTPEQIKQNMINHINTVLAHFKGRVLSWDVVNEAFEDSASGSGNWRRGLRKSGWQKGIGDDYIELAFRTARLADPDLLLYYNDYNLNNPSKSSAVRNMVKELNEKYRAEGNDRNLVDGVGMQGHYDINTNPAEVRTSIKKFVEAGVKVDISELDIEDKFTFGNWGNGKDGPMGVTEKAAQARLYRKLFLLFREYDEHINRVTMWGLDDSTNWKSVGNPCLFDGNLKPKPAFFTVAYPDLE